MKRRNFLKSLLSVPILPAALTTASTVSTPNLTGMTVQAGMVTNGAWVDLSTWAKSSLPNLLHTKRMRVRE